MKRPLSLCSISTNWSICSGVSPNCLCNVQVTALYPNRKPRQNSSSQKRHLCSHQQPTPHRLIKKRSSLFTRQLFCAMTVEYRVTHVLDEKRKRAANSGPKSLRRKRPARAAGKMFRTSKIAFSTQYCQRSPEWFQGSRAPPKTENTPIIYAEIFK